jgi:hypothetical protein
MTGWYQNKVDEECMIKKQFDQDNIFYFGKDIWKKEFDSDTRER